MKLTQKQAIDLAAAMAVEEGMCSTAEAYERKIYAKPDEVLVLQEAFSAILGHAIARGLVIAAAPRPERIFVDLRQL